MPKSNLPFSLNDERKEYQRLYEVGITMTTTGNVTFTSTSSGSTVTYNTATYAGGIYNNQGEYGMFQLLQSVLVNSNLNSIDINEIAGESNQNQSLTYTNGTLTKVTSYWSDGTTTKETQDLSYTSGTLTSVVTKRYNESGVLQTTITETLNYTSGVLTSVGRVVA